MQKLDPNELEKVTGGECSRNSDEGFCQFRAMYEVADTEQDKNEALDCCERCECFYTCYVRDLVTEREISRHR